MGALSKPVLFTSLFPEPYGAGKVETLVVRVLNANDSNAFRAIRLEALKNEGHLLGPTYEKENAITDENWWRGKCTETQDNCMLGLFEGGSLIGFMGVKKWDEAARSLLPSIELKAIDPDVRQALWGPTYLKNEYRGEGHAALLYKAREQWTAQHKFEKAVFFIHADNKRSREIHERNGAVCTSTQMMQWPDRPLAAWGWFEKRLAA